MRYSRTLIPSAVASWSLGHVWSPGREFTSQACVFLLHLLPVVFGWVGLEPTLTYCFSRHIHSTRWSGLCLSWEAGTTENLEGEGRTLTITLWITCLQCTQLMGATHWCAWMQPHITKHSRPWRYWWTASLYADLFYALSARPRVAGGLVCWVEIFILSEITQRDTSFMPLPLLQSALK